MSGDFREDLYYRLNVITFGLPPLRDRGGDILLLARFFLKKYAGLEGKPFNDFTRDAIQIICGYDWPGNVRQLENVVHGMVVLNNGKKITAEMIIKSLSNTVTGFSAPVPSFHSNTSQTKAHDSEQAEQDTVAIIPLWQVEKQAIESAIAYCQGNVPKAAALLEVSPSTLYRKKQSW